MRTLAASERGARLLFVLLLTLVMLPALLVWKLCSGFVFKQREAACKQRVHEVQLALERYCVDDEDERYPASLDLLIGSEYLPQMPQNPFSGEPMRWVLLDEQLQPLSPPGRGDFGYLPRLDPDGSVGGYSLALFTRFD
ncbi:hypothetical protein IT575_11745 [bacterium]|nr:hypothetical protein [bacterium]